MKKKRKKKPRRKEKNEEEKVNRKTNVNSYRPSEVIRMREISAGVPTKAPIPPAAIPIAALVKKFGGLPSLLKDKRVKCNQHCPQNVQN